MAKIMIIEDNENIKKELTKLLRRYGYDIYGEFSNWRFFKFKVMEREDFII